MHNRFSARPSYQFKSGYVALLHRCITTVCFQNTLRALMVTVQAKNSIRNAPTSSALIQVSHRSHNTCTANCHVCSKGKRNRAQREALVEPWFKHLNCCGWWKGISTDEATFNSEEIKPVAIAIIKLHVSEGISRSVSQSVSQSASQPVSQSASQPVSQSVSIVW